MNRYDVVVSDGLVRITDYGELFVTMDNNAKGKVDAYRLVDLLHSQSESEELKKEIASLEDYIASLEDDISEHEATIEDLKNEIDNL